MERKREGEEYVHDASIREVRNERRVTKRKKSHKIRRNRGICLI